MSRTKIDHIGIAVQDIEKALHVFRDCLGLELESKEELASQKLAAYRLRIGESHIELLHATSPGSVIARFIERRGPGLHHISLAVDDIDAEAHRLAEAGLEPLSEKASEGAGGARILFFHPRSTAGVLVELCQRSETD